MLAYDRASPRDVTSLRNWLAETGCLTRTETAYLKQFDDLVTLGSSADPALKRLEDWTEDQLIQHYPGLRKV